MNLIKTGLIAASLVCASVGAAWAQDDAAGTAEAVRQLSQSADALAAQYEALEAKLKDAERSRELAAEIFDDAEASLRAALELFGDESDIWSAFDGTMEQLEDLEARAQDKVRAGEARWRSLGEKAAEDRTKWRDGRTDLMEERLALETRLERLLADREFVEAQAQLGLIDDAFVEVEKTIAQFQEVSANIDAIVDALPDETGADQ